MKKQLKNLSLILLLIFSSQLLSAQTEKQTPTKVPDMLQNADYVFEGTVVDVVGYRIPEGKIYTSLLIQVSNVFKGNGMKLGLVQIIVKGGEAPLPDNNEMTEHIPYYAFDEYKIPKLLRTGEKGIIAGMVVPYNKGYKRDGIKIENSIVLEQSQAILYCDACWDYKYFAPWAGDFGNAKALRKSIKSFNLTTDYVDRTDVVEDSIQKIKDDIAIKEKIKLDTDYQIRLKEYELHQQKLKSNVPTKEPVVKKNAITNAKLNVNNDIYVDSRNFTYSTNGSNQKFIDFDVFVWSTQPKYLNDLLVRYNYDKYVFGNSVASAGNATATLGTTYNSINYKIYGGAVDANDSVIALSFGANDSLVRPNRIALSSSPTQLMHLKLKINNCVATTKMAFDYKFVMALETDYVLNANDSVYAHKYFFDTVYYNDYSPIPLCPMPKITGFSPSVIRAGTNEVLTITGTNFGNTRGKGQVLFPDADSIGRYMQGCDTLDYVSWTNTEIKVKVPSLVINNNYTIKGTAGSGKFKVVNDLGFRDSTTTDLDVQYSIDNESSINSNIKYRSNMVYYNCSNSARTFKLGNTLSSNPQAVALIDSAINTWARTLNIDIRLQKDDYNNYQYFADNAVDNEDTICMIYVKNYSTDPVKPLMRTNTKSYSCSSGTKFLKVGADIGINMVNPVWHYTLGDAKPSGKNDFFQAILHELGHALGLLHVINPIVNGAYLAADGYGELMHPYNANGAKTANQRSTLNTGRLMAKAGGLNIRDSSKLMNWTCAGVKKIREFKSPSSKVGCIGAPVSFTAYCEQPSGSPAPTYQWQHLNTLNAWVNSTSFNLAATVTGATTSTFTISNPGTLLNGKPFRCVISNVDGCTIYTQVATLTFNTPSFYANPTNQTINENTNRNLPAQSADTLLQYKWQQKLAGSSVYNDINNGGYFSGTTTQTLSIINTPYSFDQSYFRCKGTNTAGCVGYSTAAKITVNPTGFAPSNPTSKTIASNLRASVFPNPSSNSITISLDDAKLIQKIEVFNSKGNVVTSNNYNTNTATLDISSFPTGLYMIKISDGNSEITKEIVITH